MHKSVSKQSVKPVMVEVVPASDVENQQDQLPTATATEVRTPYRPVSISTVIGEAAPAPESPRRAAGALSEREKILLEGYKTSRIVRIFTFIEIGFILLFGILVPAFLCVLPFPLAGYIGARKWSHCLLYTFAIYTALEVVVGIVSLFFFFKEPVYFGLRIVDIVFNCVVLRYTNSLTAFARALEPADLNFLQNSQAIKTIEQGLLF